MDKTKIDWCDSTWNPVTGCLHNCKYCYARGIANRFKGTTAGLEKFSISEKHELKNPLELNGKKAPYPYGFEPTLHEYRLNDYTEKKGRNIFVCSMADLFGEWVPDEWIEEVFTACDKAPQHNYLFLTKNPERYVSAIDDNYKDCIKDHMSNFWFGVTVATKNDARLFNYLPAFGKRFVSIEPLLEDLEADKCNLLFKQVHWVIIGAETGKRKDKVVPERKWIEDIVKWCNKFGTPVFMKSSLFNIWGGPLIQEFPKELK